MIPAVRCQKGSKALLRACLMSLAVLVGSAGHCIDSGLADRVRSPDIPTRTAAILALGNDKSPEAYSMLISLLASENDSWTRCPAIDALVSQGNPAFREVFRAICLSDKDSFVRGHAVMRVSSVEKDPGEARALLRQVFTTEGGPEDTMPRLFAVEALGKLGDGEGYDFAVLALTRADETPVGRRTANAAVRAPVGIGKPEAIPLLEEIVSARRPAGYDAAQGVVRLRLAQLADDGSRIAYLTSVLRDDFYGSARERSAFELIETGTWAGLTAVVEAARDETHPGNHEAREQIRLQAPGLMYFTGMGGNAPGVTEIVGKAICLALFALLGLVLLVRGVIHLIYGKRWALAGFILAALACSSGLPFLQGKVR